MSRHCRCAYLNARVVYEPHIIFEVCHITLYHQFTNVMIEELLGHTYVTSL